MDGVETRRYDMIKMRKREGDVKRSVGGGTDTARSAEVQGETNFS